MTEQDMGEKIEEMGYKLGITSGNNKQPLISQYERIIGPDSVSQKQHRDPPLDYVETCAKLFKLPPLEKYGLFVAALQSSENIVISKKSIEGFIENDIIKIIASIILSSNEIAKINEKEAELLEELGGDERYSAHNKLRSENEKLFDAWKAWNEIIKLSEIIINNVECPTYNKGSDK
jgi:FtsZ-binding cell division protein ZapB